MAPEKNINAFSGDPVWSGNNLGQGIDGIGQMLRRFSGVTQNIGDEGLRLVNGANKGCRGIEGSMSDVQPPPPPREEGRDDLSQAQLDKGQQAISATASLIIS